MTTLIYSISILSTLAFVALWFRVVCRELSSKENMVEAAKSQLVAGREQYLFAKKPAEKAKAREILQRSQSVYGQSLEIYNNALRKPWNAVPALFLGFHAKPDCCGGRGREKVGTPPQGP